MTRNSNTKIFLPIKSAKSSSINMYCFPSSGASASMYAHWDNYLPEWLSALPVEYPGHGSRVTEKLVYDPEILVEDLLEIFRIHNKKPFILFGHSVGAALILRIARKMKDTNHPSYTLLRMLVISGRPETEFLPKKLNRHLLSDEEFIKEVEYYDNFSDGILKNKEILDFFLPIIRNDFHLNDHLYQDESFLIDEPILVMGGGDDKDITEQNMNAWSVYTTKWRGYHKFKGNHFYLSNGETYKEVLDVICTTFARDYMDEKGTAEG